MLLNQINKIILLHFCGCLFLTTRLVWLPWTAVAVAAAGTDLATAAATTTTTSATGVLLIVHIQSH